jgi:glycosyltransferase involved in cell wall biosynthesis
MLAGISQCDPLNLIYFSWAAWEPLARRRYGALACALVKSSIISKALYLNVPLNLWARLKRPFSWAERARLRYLFPRREHGLYVYTPLHPLPFRFQKANARVACGLTKLVICLMRLRPFLLINNCPHVQNLDPALERAVLHFVDYDDDFEVVIPDDPSDRSVVEYIRAGVSRTLGSVDCVLAVNGTLAAKAKPFCPNVLIFRNAVNIEAFEAARESPALTPVEISGIAAPIIGYMSRDITGSRMDWALLKYLTEQRPDWSFVLVGDKKRDLPLDLETARNVHVVPAVPFAELPSYLRQFSVGIVPFANNAVSHGVDAVKIYDYLAAGIPVVTTPIECAKEFGELLSVAPSKEQFLLAVEQALANRTPRADAARIAYARSNSWNSRAREFADIANTLLASRNHSPLEIASSPARPVGNQ